MGINKVKVKYRQSPNFNTTVADGLYGGTTPTGKINLNFFCDVTALPEITEVEIDTNTGAILKMNEFTGESSVVRELTTSVLVDLNVAKQIYIWLGNQINFIESQANFQAQQAQAEPKNP